MADERGRIFTDAAAYSDFHGWYAKARELRESEGPLYRVELHDRDPFWAVLGQPEVMEVERQPDLFTNEPASTLMPRRPSIDEEKPPAVISTLVNMDGEDHKQHRQLVNDWFKPGEVAHAHRAGRGAGPPFGRRDAGPRRQLRLRGRRRDELPAAGHPRDPRAPRGRVPPDAPPHPGALRRRRSRLRAHRRERADDGRDHGRDRAVHRPQPASAARTRPTTSRP